MASLNLFKSLLIIIFITFLTSYTSLALSSPRTTVKISTISAEPAVLPDSPITAPAPALSPDITPLFPTPGSGSGLSPDSSLPIIPASPSPPNPDSVGTPHPEFGIGPSGPIPESSAFGLNLSVSFSSAMMFVIGFAFW